MVSIENIWGILNHINHQLVQPNVAVNCFNHRVKILSSSGCGNLLRERGSSTMILCGLPTMGISSAAGGSISRCNIPIYMIILDRNLPDASKLKERFGSG
jgi:hypothetical protein